MIQRRLWKPTVTDMRIMDIRINKDRIKSRLVRLASYSEVENEITRPTWTKAWQKSINYIRNEMEKEGLDVRVDGIGNVIGVYNPRDLDMKPIAIGSHIDTVKNGGAFDGAAGIIAGLEVISAIRDYTIDIDRPIEIIAFAEEEGGVFGKGCIGSNYMTGRLAVDEIASYRNSRDESIFEILDRFGMKEEKFLRGHGWASDYYHSFFEIHVEQGPELEMNGNSVGIVQGVVGIARLTITFTGEANHAGTTPMSVRKDASVAMADFVKETWNLGQELDGRLVATTGNIRIWPNQHNVVPRKSQMILELRGDDDDTIMTSMDELKQIAKSIAVDYGLEIEFSKEVYTPVMIFKEKLLKVLKESTAGMDGIQDIFSWAGHDAKIMAEKMDTAMIFVPSRGGMSHCPQEYSREEDLAAVVGILINAISKLDGDGENEDSH